jgi:hypothetical protein
MNKKGYDRVMEALEEAGIKGKLEPTIDNNDRVGVRYAELYYDPQTTLASSVREALARCGMMRAHDGDPTEDKQYSIAHDQPLFAVEPESTLGHLILDDTIQGSGSRYPYTTQ